MSSNTAESRSLRSTQSDLVSLPVFSDQVASRLQSQLSTGSRGSGRTDPSLPDLEAPPPPPPPPCLRSFSGRGTCPADSSNLRKRSEDAEDHYYYYAPVYPTPSSPAGKMTSDVGNHYYCTPNDPVTRVSHAQKASDHFQYLPESPVPPPSPSLKPATFRGNYSSLPGCHGRNSSPVGGGGPDRLYVPKERSSTSRDHFNHDAWHRDKEHFTGSSDRQLGEEPEDSSAASSRASSQLPSSSSPLPHRPLVFSLGSQQVRMKKLFPLLEGLFFQVSFLY